MDFDEFREFGHASIEFIINYLSSIRERNVLPSVAPYEVFNQLPKEIPEKPEHWREVLKDLEQVILPGLTHWQSPYFNAFYPSSSSAGSIIGELLIAGIGVLGFSWVSCNLMNHNPKAKTIQLREWQVMKAQESWKKRENVNKPGGNSLQASLPDDVSLVK